MRAYKPVFQVCIVIFLSGIADPLTVAAHQIKEDGDTVKIGLLIPDNKSLAAKNGAELAVREANLKGGVKGVPVRLIVQSMEGPWGTGSNQAVSLIFDENVVAILGSHDGRNAHLVEQVAAKSRVVFLSAWSGDPTLSQAFVPWFYNCVYNDLQISEALFREIYDKGKYLNIAVITDNNYDSGSALKNFLKRVASEGNPEPLNISYCDTSQDFKSITKKLKSAEINCVVLFVCPPASLKIAQQLCMDYINMPVYGSLCLLNEDKITVEDLKNYGNVKIVSSDILSGEIGLSFREDYKNRYGRLPCAVAAYAYDAMNVLIEAIRKGGTEREKMQSSLSEIKHVGVTGIIQFDARGNRKGTPGFVEIKNGIPVSVK
jgi:branched-chain amino acid transport system substrate-binding protein